MDLMEIFGEIRISSVMNLYQVKEKNKNFVAAKHFQDEIFCERKLKREIKLFNLY